MTAFHIHPLESYFAGKGDVRHVLVGRGTAAAWMWRHDLSQTRPATGVTSPSPSKRYRMWAMGARTASGAEVGVGEVGALGGALLLQRSEHLTASRDVRASMVIAPASKVLLCPKCSPPHGWRCNANTNAPSYKCYSRTGM